MSDEYEYGPVYYGFNISTGTFTNTVLTSNYSNVQSGGFYISGKTSKLTLNNVTATENRADKGGVIFVEKKAYFEISDSVFESNQAEEGSVIYIIANRGQAAFANGSTFRSNTGIGTIFLLDGTITLTSCTIESNTVGANGNETAGVYALLSDIYSTTNTIRN